METRLLQTFLSANNLYRKQELNADPTQKGYFEEHGRIKAVRFRGHKSEGFFIPLSSLSTFAKEEDLQTLSVGTEFDEISGVRICEKYVIRTNNSNGNSKAKSATTRISRLVEGQFRLHNDTENFRKNVSKVQPNDVISITDKLHGTSFVVGRVLVKKTLDWKARLARFFGVEIKDTEYDTVYSSRRVVKNEYETKEGEHYYGYDLWAEIKDELEPSILNGITLYGEAVGFTKEGGYIQDKYDYGCQPKTKKIYIYRITQTNVDGKVIEFTWQQVKDYCNQYGLTHVPEVYYGRASNLFPLPTDNHWHANFLQYAESVYLDKDCCYCNNKVPAEGVVIRIDKTFSFDAYKLKSFRFLEHETKMLDKGIVDMESAQ